MIPLVVGWVAFFVLCCYFLVFAFAVVLVCRDEKRHL